MAIYPIGRNALSTGYEKMPIPVHEINHSVANRAIGEVISSLEIPLLTKLDGIDRLQTFKEDVYIEALRNFIF